MKVLLWLLLLEIVWGCSYANRPVNWPERGAMLCIQNTRMEALDVSASDFTGREIVLVRHLEYGHRFYGRWPFIAATGWLTASPRDHSAQHYSEVFEPWSADRWYWLTGDGRAQEGTCP